MTSPEEISTVVTKRLSWFSVLKQFGWPMAAIANKLEEFECRVLESVCEVFEKEFVHIGGNNYIWTLSINAAPSKLSTKTPIVFLHGVGTGAAMWVLNLASAANQRPVYAIDMLGFGRSSRVTFSSDPVVAEMEFVESLEAWRRAVGLHNFILIGHCFGGYIATSYALRYADRVRHLFLVDPWGFSEHPPSTATSDDLSAGDNFRYLPMPLWVRTLALLLQPFNPFAALRLAGSWGPALVSRFKPDLVKKYSHLFADDTIAQYIYHWNALTPSGEVAFKHMSYDFGWARFPMIKRVKDIMPFIPMTVVCGARSFVDSNICQQIQTLRRESFVDTHIIGGAGHFVFADKSEIFNQLVQRICSVVDHRLDIIPPRSSVRSRLRRVRSDSQPMCHNVSVLGRRRCDSQHIADEDQAELVQLASVGEPPRPVFVMSDDDYEQ